MTQRGRHDDDETQDEIDDRELPDESDMDPEDDDEPDDLVPCPHCKKKIYEDSEFCPHCGKYVSKEEATWGKPGWTVAVAIALLLAILFGWIAWPR